MRNEIVSSARSTFRRRSLADAPSTQTQTRWGSPRPTVLLCEACVCRGDSQWYVGYVYSLDGPCVRCGGTCSQVFYDNVQEIATGVNGEMRFSTCQTVQRWLPEIWDVNGYYYELGVSPHASKKELRQAYLERGGHGSIRLTYVLKVLLDDEQRASYDSSPLGTFWFDHYVAMAVKRKAMEDLIVDPELTDSDDGSLKRLEENIKNEMHLPRTLDKKVCIDKDQKPPLRPWGHYRWRCEPGEEVEMLRWSSLLVSALAERGIIRPISVGVAGHLTTSFGVLNRGGLIVFLKKGEFPTRDLAASAAEAVERIIINAHP